MDTTKQLCAGNKIGEPTKRFFKYNDKEKDAKKLTFQEIPPVSFKTRTEVN